jgi:hypothetical protein
MSELLPAVRLIALLRNPVERAISHYFHSRRKGTETLDLVEALQRERQRLDAAEKVDHYKSKAFLHQSYLSRGLYMTQLKRYFEYFSRDQLMIVTSEDLFARPAKTLSEIFAFVGVDSSFQVKHLVARNVGSDKKRVDSVAHENLEAFFRPHNEDLYRFIGRDLGW